MRERSKPADSVAVGAFFRTNRDKQYIQRNASLILMALTPYKINLLFTYLQQSNS